MARRRRRKENNKTKKLDLFHLSPGRSAKTNFPISDYDAEVAAAIAAGDAASVTAAVAAAAAAAAAASSPRSRGGGGGNRNAPTAATPTGLLRAPAPAATFTVVQLAAALTRSK